MVTADRRQFLVSAIVATWASAGGGPDGISGRSAAAAPPRRIGIGFSLYGMRSLALDAALRACRDIGYDCVELPVMADWPGDSAQLTADDKRRLRDTLATTGLRLGAVMENLSLLGPPASHAANLERLRGAGRLARELVPASPPVIETILGGRPEQWESVRDAMVERLRDWARVADEAGVLIAVKPHVGGALHAPDGAAWLIEQVGSRGIRAAFDYSHYQLRGLPLDACLDQLLPVTAFIHVKDGRGTADKFQFLLPGEGTIDYVDYFRRLVAGKYAGDVMVEVSGQIHSQPGYDPLRAARKSFQTLAAAARAAGLRSS